MSILDNSDFRKSVYAVLEDGGDYKGYDWQGRVSDETADDIELKDTFMGGDCHDGFAQIYQNRFGEEIKVEFVERYGGEEQGSDYWSVFKFISKTGVELYVKFDGYYQSYCGAEFQGYFEVEPKEKTIIVYEARK